MLEKVETALMSCFEQHEKLLQLLEEAVTTGDRGLFEDINKSIKEVEKLEKKFFDLAAQLVLSSNL